MLRVLLAQQILSVVVAVGSPHHTVDVLCGEGLPVRCEMRGIRWPLRGNCDQDDRTVQYSARPSATDLALN